jgi:hypothetical protein
MTQTGANGHELLFATSDDEAAQYYDKLTSLFQETREKLKEFNEDFHRLNNSDLKLKKKNYSSYVSGDTHQRSSAKARDSLLGDLAKDRGSSANASNSKREKLRKSTL